MSNSTLTLFCLPCAGASAIMYYRWRRLMPAWLELVPVELPGRGTRLAESLHENFETLADELSASLAKKLPQHYALFGHSLGGLLTYGIARRFAARPELPQPKVLIVSASPAPAKHDPSRFAEKKDDAALIQDLRKHGGTPEVVFESEELLAMILKVLRADYRTCESFKYRDPWSSSIPIHVLAGREDSITEDMLAAWSQETRGSFSLQWFDGGHFFIQPHETAVLAAIAKHLEPYAATQTTHTKAFFT